jgi:myo-inositol-1(or 4)-monophosphatase
MPLFPVRWWLMMPAWLLTVATARLFVAVAGGGASVEDANGQSTPIRVGAETLSEAVVATGFAPNEASLRPMVRGISAVGSRARTVRMLGSAAIMLAWVACGRLSA